MADITITSGVTIYELPEKPTLSDAELASYKLPIDSSSGSAVSVAGSVFLGNTLLSLRGASTTGIVGFDNTNTLDSIVVGQGLIYDNTTRTLTADIADNDTLGVAKFGTEFTFASKSVVVNAISGSKINAGSIPGTAIVSLDVTKLNGSDSTFSGSYISASSIAGTKIAPGTITDTQIKSDANINGLKLLNNSIDSSKLKNNTRKQTIYMQLVQKDEAISTGVKAYFYVPDHLDGAGIISAGFGTGTYSGGSISVTMETTGGTALIVATATDASYEGAKSGTLVANTKYQINITSPGSNCKGLDFWFTVEAAT